MLFERRCAGCRNPGPAICGACRSRLDDDRLDPNRSGFDRFAADNDLDRFVAAFDYADQSRALLLAAKNGGRLDVLRLLALSMIDAGGPSNIGRRVEVVTWVPSSRRRRRKRGYDQGRLLARCVARSLGVPARRLVVRADGESQAGLDRARRLLGPRMSAPGVVPERVLLVDDVATTGASLRSSAAALREAGAQTVQACVVAKVDDRLGHDGSRAGTGRLGTLG